MLVRSIRAENFMRFSRLAVTDLPLRGLIGIEGPNESGKSTIGEVLLFVFFGRTRLSAEAALTSLIRWGADSMCAEVELTIAPEAGGARSGAGGCGDFLIFRQIDRYGTNYVKALELPARREVATGNRQVAEFIARNVKFDFHEFQQSFYHDQYAERRAQGPPPAFGTSSRNAPAQACFIEAAAGLKHLRLAAEALKREVEPLEREFSYYQREVARNLVQIQKYGHNAVKVPDLTVRSAKLSESAADAARKAADVRRRAESLRAEAAVLEWRSKRVEQLPEAAVEAFPSQVEKLLGGDDLALGKQSRLLEDEGFKAPFRALREGLEGLRALASGVGDLAGWILKEREEAVRRLDPATEDGPAAARDRLEAEAAKLGRKAARSLFGAVPVLVVGAVAGVLAGAAFAGRLALRAPAFLPEALKPSIHWQLAGVSLLALVVGIFRILRGLRHRRRKAAALRSLAQLDAEVAALRRAEKELAELAAINAVKDVPSLLARTEASCVPRVVHLATDLRMRHAALLGVENEGGFEKSLAALAKADRDLRSRVLAEALRLEKGALEDEASQKKISGEKDRVDSEVRECEAQAAKKDALEAKNRELEASGALVRKEIDLRLHACWLLDETAASVRSRIGPALTRFVKTILPRLTSGRYRDVRVENDLQVRVFSSEKSDFLSIHELSGGTSEALCLALRLAVSHAFTAARTRQSQFVFLDEPFKMMDAARAVETLKILPRLSPGLEQFFVSQPNFSSEARKLLDFVIRTSHASAALDVACRAPPRTEGQRGDSSPPRSSVAVESSGSAEPGSLDPVKGEDPSPHVVEA